MLRGEGRATLSSLALSLLLAGIRLEPVVHEEVTAAVFGDVVGETLLTFGVGHCCVGLGVEVYGSLIAGEGLGIVVGIVGCAGCVVVFDGVVGEYSASLDEIVDGHWVVASGEVWKGWELA